MKPKHAAQIISALEDLTHSDRLAVLLNTVWGDDSPEQNVKRQVLQKQVPTVISEMLAVPPNQQGHGYFDPDLIALLKQALKNRGIDTTEISAQEDDVFIQHNDTFYLDIGRLRTAANAFKGSIPEPREPSGPLTPAKAKTIIEVLNELKHSSGCKPYVDRLWSDEEEAKITTKPESERPEAEKYSHLRTIYPIEIAETFHDVLKQDVSPKEQTALEGPAAAVFRQACLKRGLALGGLTVPAPIKAPQPITPEVSGETDSEFATKNLDPILAMRQFQKDRRKAPLETTQDGTLMLNVYEIRKIASQYREGPHVIGGKVTESNA